MEEKKRNRSYRRSSFTGEDIDMLRERESEERRKNDYRYKDHIDGA